MQFLDRDMSYAELVADMERRYVMIRMRYHFQRRSTISLDTIMCKRTLTRAPIYA